MAPHCPLHSYRDRVIADPEVHLSIDGSADMKGPSLARYAHPVSFICQMRSRVGSEICTFAPAAKREHRSPIPVEQWVGNAAARAPGCAKERLVGVGNNVIL